MLLLPLRPGVGGRAGAVEHRQADHEQHDASGDAERGDADPEEAKHGGARSEDDRREDEGVQNDAKGGAPLLPDGRPVGEREEHRQGDEGVHDREQTGHGVEEQRDVHGLLGSTTV